MSRCPVCDSVRIVVVVSPARRAFCARCGARWIQDGDVQRAVRPATGTSETTPPSATPLQPA